MKTPIKLEDFQRGNISIECSSQKQVDKIADWAGVDTDNLVAPEFVYAYYSHLFISVMVGYKPEEFNYKFADVELID
jgi:hypothetical protein